MLEDDVKHVHQREARIEARTSTSRMTNRAQQPLIHSKIEATQNSQRESSKREIQKLIYKKCETQVRARSDTSRDTKID